MSCVLLVDWMVRVKGSKTFALLSGIRSVFAV